MIYHRISNDENMEKYLDTPVLLTFFVKSSTLEKVFSMIREVKPRVLFLVSDGPREGYIDDVENVKKCREIVENVDWKCDVHKYYQVANRGILDNLYYGLTNAFKMTDRLIFLEDDKLPTKSFFYLCKNIRMMNGYLEYVGETTVEFMKSVHQIIFSQDINIQGPWECGEEVMKS